MRISDWSSDVRSSELEGQGIQHVDDAHHHRIDAPADETRRGAVQHADHQADDGGGEADGERDAAAIQRAHEQVAAVRIIAEIMPRREIGRRSEEHTSELQSLMRTSYAVFCLKKKHN